MSYALLTLLFALSAFGQSTVTFDRTTRDVKQTNLNVQVATFTNTAATASSVAGYDANKKLGSITIGSGLAFNAGTLSATGGGGTNLSEILVNGSSVVNGNFKDGTNSVIWALESLTNIFAFPTNILGNQITDSTITAADLGTDSVNADELSATGVEAELEAVLDLQELQGAVVANQVPDTLAFDVLTVTDDVYGAGWNGSTNVPTKNAVYDKIEAIALGGGTAVLVDGSSVSNPNFKSGTNIIYAVSDTTNVFAFPTNIVSAQVTDGTLTAGDLGTDSVSADELNATGVESELEAVLDLDALQGSVTDGQVPNDITINLAAVATQGGNWMASGTTNSTLDGIAYSHASVTTNSVTAGTGNGQIDIGSAGVRMTSNGDGAITFLGLGAGTDEDLSIDLNDNSNVGTVTSSTGLGTLNFSGIDLQVPTEAYGVGWSGDNTAPTKDAVYDKIELIVGASGDQVLVNASGVTDPNFKDGTNSVIWAVDGTNVFGFPTNVLGNQIFDATIAAADLGTDSVSADELNAAGVEAELELVLDLPELQGQIGDAQIADGAVDGGTGGEIADGSITFADLATAAKTYDIAITFDGGGSELVDNSVIYFPVPEAWTITSYSIDADQSGSVELFIWNEADPYDVSNVVDNRPTIADDVDGTAPPSLSTQIGKTSTTFTGWDTSWTAGSMTAVGVTSATTTTRVTLTLYYTK